MTLRAHTIWRYMQMSQRFALKFYKKHALKNPGVFYGQVLTNFSFSEFGITDIRHKKIHEILPC
jgi:hypothetical protein